MPRGDRRKQYGRAVAVLMAVVLGCAGPSPALRPDGAPLSTHHAAAPSVPASSARRSVDTHIVVAAEPPPAPVFTDPDRRNRILAALPQLDAYVAEEHRKLGAPGLAFGVVLDGELIFARGYGVRDLDSGEPVDETTVFRIGSITKTFTALAVLHLRDAGKVELDAPATRYLPELGKLVYPSTDSPPITLRRLLTHTSGLPSLGRFDYSNPDHVVTEAEVVDSLGGMPLSYVPDVTRSYSNLGASLAGLVVGRVSGMPYRDYVTEQILQPLGMRATVWDESAVAPGKLATAYSESGGKPTRVRHWRLGASEADGGLYSNLADMGRYAAFQLAAWPARSDPDPGPVSRASTRESHLMQRFDGLFATAKDRNDASDAGDVTASADGAGLAWQIMQSCEFEHVVWHNGGTEGYKSALYLLPERGVAVIALASYKKGLDALARNALHILASTGALAPRVAIPSAALRGLAERVVGLLTRWDDAEYERSFADSFREFLPADKARAFFDWFRERHGDCRMKGIDLSDDPTAGTVRATCERGRVFGSVGMDADHGQVNLLTLHSSGLAPSVELTSIAARTAALLGRWHDRECEKLMVPATACGDLKAAFARDRKRYGRCSLGSVADSDGSKRAEYSLVCNAVNLAPRLKIEAAGDPANTLSAASVADPRPSESPRCQ